MANRKTEKKLIVLERKILQKIIGPIIVEETGQ